MPSRLDQLADDILRRAKSRGMRLCTAESCSAGRLATALAKGGGASDCFMGGIVAYTKEAKVRLLGVSETALQQGTAVCAPVAEAMATGAVQKAGASLGVAITGVAGPDPDEDGNPVGLVYCAAARSDGQARHVRLDLSSKDPAVNIEEACVAALTLLRDFALS